jgi:hypothetical protein
MSAKYGVWLMRFQKRSIELKKVRTNYMQSLISNLITDEDYYDDEHSLCTKMNAKYTTPKTNW